MPNNSTLFEQYILNDPQVKALNERILVLIDSLAKKRADYALSYSKYLDNNDWLNNNKRTRKNTEQYGRVIESFLRNKRDYLGFEIEVNNLAAELDQARQNLDIIKKNIVPPDFVQIIKNDQAIDATNAQASAVDSANDFLQKNAELIKANYAANKSRYLIIAFVVLMLVLAYYLLKQNNKL